MAQVGLKKTYLALLDDDGKIKAGDAGLATYGLYKSNSKDLVLCQLISPIFQLTVRNNLGITEWLM